MPLNNLKIFFFGTPFFAREILADMLEKKVPIAGVVTQPDQAAGRKRELAQSEVKKLARKNELPIFQFEKIADSEIAFFKKEKPDLFVVASFGQILPKELLEIPKFGAVNVHLSLLPALRGASPIQTALWQGLKKTGSTIMLMEERLDAGPILAQKKLDVDPSENYPELEKRLLGISNELLVPTLEKWISEEIKPKKQDHSRASYCQMIGKEDGKIDFQKTAREIYNQKRAFFVWPKIFCFWEKNGQSLKLIFHELDFEDNPEISLEPGRVARVQKRIAIGTKSGLIFPREVQLQGKGKMNIESFINGQKNFVGTILNKIER